MVHILTEDFPAFCVKASIVLVLAASSVSSIKNGRIACGLCQAIRMACLNPARLLGIEDEFGSLEVGKRANLILVDDMVQVKKVFLDGSEQYET